MKRLNYIDYLRAFAIILVVVGHALIAFGAGDGIMKGVIYSFHMPLFFAISGYVAVYGRVNKTGDVVFDFSDHDFIFHKFMVIMVPYLMWGIIVKPVVGYILSGVSVDWMPVLKRNFVDNTSYWFLPCLFGLLIVFWSYGVVRQLLSKNGIKVSVFTDVLLLVLLFLTILVGYKKTNCEFLRSQISYFLPFFVGVLIAQYKMFNKIIMSNLYCFISSAIIFITFCVMFILFNESRCMRLVCGIFSVPVMFFIFSKMKINVKIANILSFIGGGGYINDLCGT